jgi:hypothetical protein
LLGSGSRQTSYYPVKTEEVWRLHYKKQKLARRLL